jgi:hypothetical protein
MDLKQSTAVTIKFGPFVDATDGVTPETGLTIAQADIRLSKNGGNIAQSNNVAGATHDELGYYDVPLDTTDTDTLGNLKVMVNDTEALPVWQDLNVMEANAYDSKYGTTLQEVNTTEVSGTAQTANDNGADINAILIDTAEIANLNDLSSADVEVAVWNEATADRTVVGSFGLKLGSVGTADDLWSATTRTLTAGTKDTEIDAILIDTAEIANLNDFDPASDDVAVVTLVGTTTTNTDMRGTENASLASALVTHDGKLDTVDSNVDAVLVDTAEIANLNDLSSAETTTAVWGVAMASNNIEDSFGNVMNDLTEEDTDIYRLNANALSEAPTGGGSSAEIADEVWSLPLATYQTSGTAGAIQNLTALTSEIDDLEAKVDIIDTNVDEVLVDTSTTIPASIANLNDLSSAEAVIASALALTNYDPPTKAEMDFAIDALNDPTATEIATEVIGTALTEPTNLADKTFGAMVYHLYSRFYNVVTQTATAQVVNKEDSVTALATMVTSDDGTTQTKGKAT